MEDDNIIFDEDKAVEYIRNNISAPVSEKYTDDDLLNVIDIIWDYYEKNGFLSLNLSDGEEDQLDEDLLIKYVKQEVKGSDYINMEPKDVENIVKAELAYEESLEDII